MASDPVSAGRKGGQSRSERKLAACKRNGFQRVYQSADEQPAASAESEQHPQAAPVLIVVPSEPKA